MMNKPLPSRRWSILTLSLALGLYGVAGAFNAVVDPWGLNHLWRAEGVNAVKTEVFVHTRQHKYMEAQHIRPQAISLGSSRTLQGILSDHAGWQAKPVYNMAQYGSNPAEQVEILKRLHARSPLKEVVLGLDFFTFNDEYRSIDKLREDVKLLSDASKAVPLYFSLDMLKDSFTTIRKQGTGYDHILAGGETNPRSYLESNEARRGGVRESFTASERFFVENVYLPAPTRTFTMAAPDKHGALNAYRQILAFCRDNGIVLHQFISPSHARQWEIMKGIGLWDEWETWKRMVVALNEETFGAGKYRLLDFSGYNTYTIEAVPALGSKAEMQYYWESNHYSPALGNKLMDVLLLGKADADGSFGMPLNAQTVEKVLARIAEARKAYAAANPAEMLEVQSTFPAFLKP